jgi:hypothetical protein
MTETLLSRVLLVSRAALEVIFDLYFLWLPIFLLILFWGFWKRYVVTDALINTETTLLQIKLPQEITKSPKAMELFLQNVHQTGGEGNFYAKYWKGGTRPWFSLELVSINGEIRFYIWTREKHAKVLETQIYAQYPSVEIIVGAEDYAKKVKYDPDEKNLFGSMFTLIKDDPYPIKTYIDYGLDKDPKEEFKVDPISAMIEFLGSMNQGEQVWIQILIRAHKKYEKKSVIDKIKKQAEKALSIKERKNQEEKGKKLVGELRIKDIPESEEEIEKRKIRQTKFTENVIEAIERSVNKPGFDCAIRAIYIADEDKFDKANIGGLLGSLKQYNSDGLNGFKPGKKTDFDFPWQDPLGGRLAKEKVKIFGDYIKRAHFETRHNVEDFILNTEELATIFHFPGSTVETPTLPRILSKKAEPPTNLPL